MSPTYELVFQGDRWVGVRDGQVWHTWPREADPYGPGDDGLLVQLSFVVQQRWGRLPEWVLLPDHRGWRAV